MWNTYQHTSILIHALQNQIREDVAPFVSSELYFHIVEYVPTFVYSFASVALMQHVVIHNHCFDPKKICSSFQAQGYSHLNLENYWYAMVCTARNQKASNGHSDQAVNCQAWYPWIGSKRFIHDIEFSYILTCITSTLKHNYCKKKQKKGANNVQLWIYI